ncbi:MAG TPA: PAS domain S-box protein, partial [Thermoanaerobaculia bacterium]|nr:PAS domain S-box protein [Thermoanaerobaculia bacterium]
DATGRFIRVNQAFARLVGRSIEELVGNDSSAFTHPDDLALTSNTLRTAPLSQEAPRIGEKRYVRKDGSIVWARTSLSSAIGDDGTTKYLVGMAEDITAQKRTSEELVETRRKLRSALIAGEVATYEWDVTSDRLWGDANFDQIFGTERDADGTAPLARFVAAIHPDDRARVMAAVNHTVETGAEYDIEYRVVNGEMVRWVSARGRLERDDERGIVRFHGVVLDVTARKLAEQELERRSRLYDAFLSNTDDLVYLIDREGRFVYANRALLALWGMTLDQVSGKTLYELGYPEWHADMNMREFAQVVETKKTIRGSVPYTSPTGVSGTFEYVFSPVLGDGGEVELIAGTSRDVTERMTAAETLRQLSGQLRLALEAAHMGWWQFDLTTGRVYLDERTRAILGVAHDDSTYQDILARIVPEDAAKVDAAIKAAIDPHRPRPYDVEYRVRLADGSIRWLVSKGRPTFQGEGEERRAVTFVGTALDVTDTKLAQDALQEVLASERAARAEAERASRMKDEFLATLSHELRTPLAAVLGWAQILGGGGATSEEIEEGISIIARNARAQAQIIEDLLEMSRIVSGKIRLEVQPLLLLDVVRAAVATVQAAADAKDVRVSVSASEEKLRISGDVNRLQQVFWNLLSNAVKFTPAGGSINVELIRDEAQVQVCVTDTGEGIRPEFLPFVFDRFRQADATTTRRHGGLGLGLAIVKQLTELHGGSVAVHSEGPGKGARFSVQLPLVAARQRAPREEPAHVRKRVRAIDGLCEQVEGVRVLVVDDESDARGVVRRFLEDCGAVVTAASSAAEAMERLAADAFDVLVSDIGMPHEDGYSLIRNVRARGNHIPAIALTAYARPEDRVHAVDAGYQTHLAKPADPSELIALVADLARKQRTRGQDV